jgi:hypothetical protein
MWGHFLIKPTGNGAYAPLTSPAKHAVRMVDWLRFRQPTSAVKVAKLVWELGHCVHPPLRLLLGSHAVDSVRDRLRSTLEEVSFGGGFFYIFFSFLVFVGRGVLMVG